MLETSRWSLNLGRVASLGSLAVVALLAQACGPQLSTSIRTETAFAPGDTGLVEKDGLAIEVPNLKTVPEQFLAEAKACDANGVPVLDPLTNAQKVIKVFAVSLGAELFQVKLTNNTDHVVRLGGAVLRLFDPAENAIEPQSKEEATATATRGSVLAEQGACPNAAGPIKDALATVRFIGPNTELLPSTSTVGYLLFQPPNVQLAGTWKLALYEIPVKVDAAGNPVTKTRFEFGFIRKRIQDTYSQSLMGEKTLVSSKEVP